MNIYYANIYIILYIIMYRFMYDVCRHIMYIYKVTHTSNPSFPPSSSSPSLSHSRFYNCCLTYMYQALLYTHHSPDLALFLSPFALQRFSQVTHQITLSSVCQRYKAVHFYEGIVELALSAATHRWLYNFRLCNSLKRSKKKLRQRISCLQMWGTTVT